MASRGRGDIGESRWEPRRNRRVDLERARSVSVLPPLSDWLRMDLRSALCSETWPTWWTVSGGES